MCLGAEVSMMKFKKVLSVSIGVAIVTAITSQLLLIAYLMDNRLNPVLEVIDSVLETSCYAALGIYVCGHICLFFYTRFSKPRTAEKM